MKKFAIAIIAILYMGISSGIAMEIHYCMGKKAGVDFYGEKKDECGKCGMKEKKNCCNDEYKFYKLNDSHKNLTSHVLFGRTEAMLVPIGVPLQTIGYVKEPGNNNFKELSPPPPPAGINACRMNCIFRI